MNQTPWLARLFLPLAGAHPPSVNQVFRPPFHLPTFVAVLMVIKLINLTLTARIQEAFAPHSTIYRLIEAGTHLATGLLLVSIVLALGAWVFSKVATPRLALPLMIVYLSIATINASGTAAHLGAVPPTDPSEPSPLSDRYWLSVCDGRLSLLAVVSACRWASPRRGVGLSAKRRTPR